MNKIYFFLSISLIVFILLNNCISEDAYKSSSIPKDYLVLLDIDSVDVSYSKTLIKNNSVVTIFDYKNVLSITMLKFEIDSSASLYNIIKKKQDLISIGIDGGVIYSGLDNGFLKMNFSWSFNSELTNSILIRTPETATIKEIINTNNFLSYHCFNTKGVNFKINNRDYDDICIEILSPNTLFNNARKFNNNDFYLFFKKSGKSLYAIYVNSIDKETRIDPELIDSLFNM